MSHRVRVLCRPDVATGFGLAGLSTIPVEGPDASARLRELVEHPEIGVVLLEQQFHDSMPAELRRDLARRSLPLVVPFSGPAWDRQPGQADERIVELLRQAIGYRVRLT